MLPYTAIYILNVHLEMCPEILYSAITKYLEIFFDALKTGQNEKPYFFQEFGIPEIHARLTEKFENLQHFKLDALPSQKTMSGSQMELSLAKIA